MAAQVPLATYRLQFNAQFGFRDAIGILDYLRDLGISHVYASPILTSRRGSGHGYDVTDPLAIDPELGGEEGFAAFQGALHERGMGLLLDIVPNHMAASSQNRWWMDVLEFGADSPFAAYFDINWHPPSLVLQDKLLLPFLGKPFGEVLDQGELKVSWQDGKFVLHYGDEIFPIAPRSYAQILRYRESELRAALDPESPAANEWRGIVAAAESIAADKSSGVQAAAERRTKFELVRERLRQLLATSPEIGWFLETTIRAINGGPHDPRSMCGLEQILSAQHYRLAFWQSASGTINYRRFFSITDLVGVRVEDPSVFQPMHELVARLAANPSSSGFRIDHIDGLRDPRGYLTRLRELLAKKESSAGGYLLVEKILARDEFLPTDWQVEGTTGYDYLNFANRLMVDQWQAQAIVDVYSRWTSTHANFDDIVYEKKLLVMRTLLGVEMRALGRELAEHAADDRYARELDPLALSQALIQTTACLPVYRTYIQSLEPPDTAKEKIGEAIRLARTHAAHLPPACFDFVSDVLLLIPRDHVRPDQREARLTFVTRWQQFTGSIMAKGVEDTALYVYFPLLALNEVGGDPRVRDGDPLAFHQFISQRQKNWPHTMNATTTHDTKRSEDARARIAVLSEIPGEWESKLQEWSQANEKHLRHINGAEIPDRNEQYLFYQTLVGSFPLQEDDWASFVLRIQEYLIKAGREAKVNTRWTQPSEAHESAIREFVAGVLDRRGNREFCESFERFNEHAALYGMLNGLSQTVLKIATPGVPDCYQGSELWDTRLVDPDNRGQIDFTKRLSMLKGLREGCKGECSAYVEGLLTGWRDARVKLHVMMRALNARRENAELFSAGSYMPLELSGGRADRAVAFARQDRNDWAICVTPRCVASLRAPVMGKERREFWKGTKVRLPEGAPAKWSNILAGKNEPKIAKEGEFLPLADVFAGFPAALLLAVRE